MNNFISAILLFFLIIFEVPWNTLSACIFPKNICQYFKNTFNIIVNIIILRLTKYMSVDNIKLMIFTNSMWTLLFLYSFQYRPQIHTAFVMSDAVNEPEPVFLCVSLMTLPYSCIMQAPAKQYIVSKLLSIVYGC